MCKCYPGGTGFEGMKGSCKATEARHCERPWKAIGEGAASVAVDSLGMKGSYKKKVCVCVCVCVCVTIPQLPVALLWG